LVSDTHSLPSEAGSILIVAIVKTQNTRRDARKRVTLALAVTQVLGNNRCLTFCLGIAISERKRPASGHLSASPLKRVMTNQTRGQSRIYNAHYTANGEKNKTREHSCTASSFASPSPVSTSLFVSCAIRACMQFVPHGAPHTTGASNPGAPGEMPCCALGFVRGAPLGIAYNILESGRVVSGGMPGAALCIARAAPVSLCAP